MFIKYIIFIFIFFTFINSYAQNTTLRMANWLPPTHPWVANIMIPWINNVEIATEGRIKIDIKSSFRPSTSTF